MIGAPKAAQKGRCDEGTKFLRANALLQRPTVTVANFERLAVVQGEDIAR